MSIKTIVRLIIVAAILASIAACLYFLGRGDLTAKESALLSIVLTGLSILASWAVTDMYSASQSRAAIDEVQEQHRTNLRTYAKAAEKVTNLSNELNRLSAYLQQELDCTEYRNAEEELLAKEERVESAIHIINTLKSVNDTSLSDWQGVIGDELEEQREEKSEREAEMRAALAQMEEIVALQLSELQSRQESTQDVRAEVDALRRDLRYMVSTAGGLSVPLPRITRTRQEVEKHCPVCNVVLKYKQWPRPGSIKALKCIQCNTSLVARYDDGQGYYLLIRKPQNESIVCPTCEGSITVSLDPVPGKALLHDCGHCAAQLRISRSAQSVTVRLADKPSQPITSRTPDLNPEILQRVASAMPPQPWPQGAHRKAAESLDLSIGTVRRAVDQLIQEGRFLPQINGRLYKPVEMATLLEVEEGKDSPIQ